MPIALLLQESVLTFRFGGWQMTPWVHLAQVEETLIARAQSAFLTRWFGTNLPLKGLHLRVFIQNVEEFRARYLQALNSAESEISSPNLTEPLAGAAGNIAGLIFFPTGMALMVAVSVRRLKGWLGTLLIVLTSIIGAPFVWSAEVAGIVLGLGLPLGLIGGVAVGTVKEERTGAAIDLLGSLARLLDSARILLGQIMGPRDEVANPLLRQLLKVLDSLAGLAPQLLGFIAIVITRLGPLLLPLVAQMNAFKALFATAIEVAKFLINDMLDRFKKLLDADSPGSVLKILSFVIERVTMLLPSLIDTFIQFFEKTSDTFKEIYASLVGDPRSGLRGLVDLIRNILGGVFEERRGFKGFFKTMSDRLSGAFTKSPLMTMINAAKAAFGAGGAAMSGDLSLNISGFSIKKKGSSGGASSMPAFPVIDLTSPAKIESDLGGPPLLGFGAIEPFARAEDFLKRIFVGNPAPLAAEAEENLKRIRNPASVFEAERQALKAALGNVEPKEALARQVAAQQELRELILGVVGRVLPPEIRPYIDTIGNAFSSLDNLLLFRKKADKSEFPVRDLPDNGKLLPVVRRLTFQAAGVRSLDVREFASLVSKALVQEYPATVSAIP